MTRLQRRAFLQQWAGGVLLAGSGSIIGAVAARQGYAELSLRDLGRLNAGRGSELYDSRRRSAQPPSSSATGQEPPLFVAQPAVAGIAHGPVPLTIAIPAIELESDCVELSTQMIGGVLVWKTADHSVGHHTGTATPGQTGNCVFSGHISSPLSHEGNVFHRLPELASKLGSDVQIVMEGGRRVHYELVGTQVVTPADTWVMEPTPDPIVTLITCVPDGIYTHRLIVSGTLVS